MSGPCARWTVLVIFALLAWPGMAEAEYLSGDRSARREPQPEVWAYANAPSSHDQGLLLRGTVGPAWSMTRTRTRGAGPAEISLEGPALGLSLALGGVVHDDLAIHGTVTTVAAARPHLVVDGNVYDAAFVGSLLVGAGPGITAYLPGNAFVSSSLGPAVLRLDFEGRGLGDPDLGIGFFWELLVGKEWWVAPRMGVGFAGHLTAHRVTTDLVDPFGGVAFGIDLTVTFN